MTAGIRRCLGLLVLALLLLLAGSPVFAGVGPKPADTTGPTITFLEVDPNPVLPGSMTVRATAADDASVVVAGEFLVDDPVTSPRYLLTLADGSADTTTEDLEWVGTYDSFPPGLHTLWARARDAANNWGLYDTIQFFVANATTLGPTVGGVSVAPTDVSLGAAVTIAATASTPFAGSSVEAAEYFVDTPGDPGTGTAMQGAFGSATVPVDWSGVLVLPRGAHAVYVHARNDAGTWGDLGTANLTVRAPDLATRLLVDRVTARPGEDVTYTVVFENAGNADATSVWVNVTLPSAVAYLADTAADAGGVRTAGTHYVFTDVAPEVRGFTIRSQVAAGTPDATPLEAAVDVDFTNDAGWDFPAVRATATGDVVAPELALALQGPTTANAGEAATYVIQLNNVGSRTIPTVDVALLATPAPDVVADTAANLGGMPTGPGSWRFPDLPQGSHSFVVLERVPETAANGAQLARIVSVTYVSRSGTGAEVREVLSLQVAAPSFTLRATADRREVPEGEAVAIAVRFANGGSVPAGSVWINLTLPRGLALAGGDPPTASAGGRASWRFTDVAPGSYALTVLVRAQGVATFSLAFALAYTSPNGVFLAIVGAPAVLAVLPAPAPVAGLTAVFAFVAVAVAVAGFLATERGAYAVFRRLGRGPETPEVRARVGAFVLNHPGASYAQIREFLALPNGPLARHLSALEAAGAVRSEASGKYRRFYPK